MVHDRDTMQSDYNHLLTLWTSGVRDYHTMLSDYLTANSIFVAVIGLLVSRESLALPFTIVIVLLSMIGILMSAQMAIVLGRFSGQNALWEWQLRGMATLPAVRGEGHGAALIRAAEAFVREHGGRVAWFNARRAAEGFYAHMGYRTVSEEFDVPGIGPHVVMEKRLAG